MDFSVKLCMGQCNCDGNQQGYSLAKAKLAVLQGLALGLSVVSPDSFYEMNFLHMHS